MAIATITTTTTPPPPPPLLLLYTLIVCYSVSIAAGFIGCMSYLVSINFNITQISSTLHILQQLQLQLQLLLLLLYTLIVCYSVSIAAGFIGWMSYLVSIILQHHTDLVSTSSTQTLTINPCRHQLTLLRITFLSAAAAIAVFLLGLTSHLM